MVATAANIIDAVRTALNAQGFTESPFLSDAAMRDPSVYAQLTYAITVPRTEVVEARRMRANTDGIACRSIVRVRMLWHIQVGQAADNYVQAIDVAGSVHGAIASIQGDGSFGAFALQSIEHAVVGDDTAVLCTLEWSVRHQLFAWPADYTPPD